MSSMSVKPFCIVFITFSTNVLFDLVISFVSYFNNSTKRANVYYLIISYEINTLFNYYEQRKNWKGILCKKVTLIVSFVCFVRVYGAIVLG